MYDVAVIGAGINGCASVYELTQKGQRVVLFDEGGIAAGGSGAAGAFISPKFSKGGDLKELLHTAFLYSMKFYDKNFPQLLTKTPLLHIAKDANDAQILQAYKKSTTLKLLNIKDEMQESVCIDAGIVNAKKMCEALAKSATLKEQKVNSLEYIDGVWIINETYCAKEVVLATGAYNAVIQEPYIQFRGVWGHRIDIKTSTQNPYSIHRFVSISPTNNGSLAIGATHNVEYHPQNSQAAYDILSGREELLQKASQTINLKDVTVVKDYMGLRSGSFDYMPLVGSLVLSRETLSNQNINFFVKKADFSQYSYYPNLTMINGSGGYGFVLAPYLAKILCDYILSNKTIDKKFHPARFFARWVKKR